MFHFHLVSEASLDEERLLNDLFLNGYKKEMRPVLNDSDKVVVKIGLSLSQIINVVSTLAMFTEIIL
jgi:hypothetical protein